MELAAEKGCVPVKSPNAREIEINFSTPAAIAGRTFLEALIEQARHDGIDCIRFEANPSSGLVRMWYARGSQCWETIAPPMQAYACLFAAALGNAVLKPSGDFIGRLTADGSSGAADVTVSASSLWQFKLQL